MTESTRVELWRKAAVLGSLWAASEIVLGAFMHNARIPLTGNILTGIGIAILVAGHRLWPERGLFWRAGLICAAMKSVSPSAVILAPMIAISAEGFLLEAGVALGGANVLGYLLAGALAMSWPLAHKVGGAVLFYGPETIVLYTKGFAKAQAWLGFAPTNPWTPLFILWAAHLLGGCFAAAAGMRVGRTSPAASPAQASPVPAAPPPRERGAAHEHSLTALFLHLLCVMAAMSFGNKLGAPLFAVVSAAYATACVLRYPRAARLLKRLSLWTGILIAAILAGLILGRWQVGADMALRALVLTVGFACIGEELLNPVLRSWLERRGGRLFFAALEQAFETLPAVFAALPSGEEVMRSPIESLAAAISRAPELLERLTQARVFIITGAHGGGKSDLVRDLAQALRAAGLSVGGIHAPGWWADGRRGGFDVIDLGSGETKPLCRKDGPQEWEDQGCYRFSPEGLAFGLEALAGAGRRDADVVIVDEVGPFEVAGKGWAPGLDALAERKKPMVWVVRKSLIEDVRLRWGIAKSRIVETGGVTAPALAAEIARELSAAAPVRS
ncbi:MAG: DUF2478 domain-containing protein [Elusimicrobia bacterium]|nr:DUF2478 domain-containing protein [Elusimicrobiota bacterium]